MIVARKHKRDINSRQTNTPWCVPLLLGLCPLHRGVYRLLSGRGVCPLLRGVCPTPDLCLKKQLITNLLKILKLTTTLPFSGFTLTLFLITKPQPELMERKKRVDMHINLATALSDAIRARNLDKFFETEEKIMTKTTLEESVLEVNKAYQFKFLKYIL